MPVLKCLLVAMDELFKPVAEAALDSATSEQPIGESADSGMGTPGLTVELKDGEGTCVLCDETFEDTALL